MSMTRCFRMGRNFCATC